MTTQVTLPYGIFSEIASFEYDDTIEVSISLGCAEFAKRDINADGFAVHLSLKNSEGKFWGNGAYSGFVTAFEQDVLEQLWAAAGELLNQDELFLSAGANEGDFLDEDGEAICSDCLAASCEFDEETTSANPVSNCVCWSCKQMIEESMWMAEQNRQWDSVA
jgi:hypothetical protein